MKHISASLLSPLARPLFRFVLFFMAMSGVLFVTSVVEAQTLEKPIPDWQEPGDGVFVQTLPEGEFSATGHAGGIEFGVAEEAPPRPPARAFATPEPAALGLVLAGGALLALRRRRNHVPHGC